ncbi:MAG: 4Fe-4S dicluster domain-containing protein [Bacteroidales bacterium]
MTEKGIYLLNTGIIIIGVPTIGSSVILELAGGKTFMSLPFNNWVWLHLISVLLFSIIICLHIFIHWKDIRFYNWKYKSKITKWLTYLWILTGLSGIPATILFISDHTHNPVGGIHGKFGILLILFALFHIRKRLSWFKGRRTGKAFIPVINPEQCISCGLCLKACPSSVYSRHNKQIRADNPLFCIQCYKCYAKCPRKAISNHN